jgi:hypothetical protein
MYNVHALHQFLLLGLDSVGSLSQEPRRYKRPIAKKVGNFMLLFLYSVLEASSSELMSYIL